MEKNLLILEDDLFAQEIYQYIFGKAKIKCKIVDNPKDLFEQLAENSIGAIIMDVRISNAEYENKRVTGIDLSRIVKQNNDYSHLPIILATAFINDGNKKTLLEESLADDYITKPITDFNGLIAKINGYLSFND